MMNKKGFARHEVLTIIALIIIITAIVMNYILESGKQQKFETMKSSAQNFASVVAGNLDGFDVYFNDHYLGEVIDNGLLSNIKSPFSGKSCDINESKVLVINGKRFVTLRCDDYLIDNQEDSALDKMIIYKVSKWSDKKQKGNNQELEVYNCVKDNKEVFEQYLESTNFLYNVNKKYSKSYTSIDSVKESCHVKSKKIYRTKIAIDE